MRAPLLLAASTLLLCCGKSTPCSGSNCTDVAGQYLVTFSPALACNTWAYQPAPTSSMTVIQDGSAIELDMQPSALSPTHVLHGTLDTHATLVATEAAPDPRLDLPYGQLSGSFVAGASDFVFQGTLTLLVSGFPGDAGAGQSCTGTYNVTAQRTSGGPADAGAFDGGAIDAGRPDAGDGG